MFLNLQRKGLTYLIVMISPSKSLNSSVGGNSSLPQAGCVMPNRSPSISIDSLYGRISLSSTGSELPWTAIDRLEHLRNPSRTGRRTISPQ